MAHADRTDTLGAALDPAVEKTVREIVRPCLEWAKDADPALYVKAVRLWHEHGGLLRIGLSLSITSLESLLRTEHATDELRDIAERGFENVPAALDRAMKEVPSPSLPDGVAPPNLFEAPRLYAHLLLKKRLDERLTFKLPENEWLRWLERNQPFALRAFVRDIRGRVERGSARLATLDAEVMREYYRDHPDRAPRADRRRRITNQWHERRSYRNREQRRLHRQRRWERVKSAIVQRIPRWIRKL